LIVSHLLLREPFGESLTLLRSYLLPCLPFPFFTHLLTFTPMRKLYTLAACALLVTATHAQTTVFFDNFESNSLEGYTLHNVDGLMPFASDLTTMVDSAWTIKVITTQGWPHNRSAFSVSWYVNDEGPSNDWLVTPAIQIAGNAELSWNALAITSSGNFRDRYQVFVSSGPSLEDLEEAQLVFDTGAIGELPTPQFRSVNLAAAGFANQTIYIAFRNFTQPFGSNPGGPGNGGNELAIDNVRVTDNSLSTRNNDGPLRGLTVLPNPSNGIDVKLQFYAERTSLTTLEVVDLTGKVLRVQNLGMLATGTHLIDLDRRDLANGVYFINLRTDDGRAVAKAILN
jgi:hypothetical protein